jgi:peptide/nickel transport system ATP-binding protein
MDPANAPHQAAPDGRPAQSGEPALGCRFRTRCPHAEAVCAARKPVMARSARATGRLPHGLAGSGHSKAGEPRGMSESDSPWSGCATST